MQKIRALAYVIVGIVGICTFLDVITQPLLWPLALAGILFLIVELSAYHFPIIWYLYSHPYHARRRHKTR